VRGEGARIKGDERIPGSTEFVRQVLEAAGEQTDRKALAVSGGLTVGTPIARVAEHFNLTASELKSANKVRRVSPARMIFRVLAVRDPGASCVDLAWNLGLSPSAVSKTVAKDAELEGLGDLRRTLLG
jgi:chromosomal replication initiation ATPase DnaA